MKQLFITLLLTIIGLKSFAQLNSDSSVHLSFKGVPINGTLEEYISQMRKTGFVYSGRNEGVAILEGEFASYPNCTVGVYTTKKDLVSKIIVHFPDLKSWSSLSSSYSYLKGLLTEKYGKPSEIVEKFQSYTPEDDGSKMIKVRLGACKYYSTYLTEKGTIQLSIETEGTVRCFVQLAYFDKINCEAVKKSALSDL